MNRMNRMRSSSRHMCANICIRTQILIIYWCFVWMLKDCLMLNTEKHNVEKRNHVIENGMPTPNWILLKCRHVENVCHKSIHTYIRWYLSSLKHISCICVKFIRQYQGAYMSFACALARFSIVSPLYLVFKLPHEKCISLYIYFFQIESNATVFFSFFLHFLLILSTPFRTFFSYNFLVIYQHLTRVSVFSNLRTNIWEKKTSPRPRKQNIFCWFTCTFHFIRAWHTGSMGSLFSVFKLEIFCFGTTLATENSSLKLNACARLMHVTHVNLPFCDIVDFSTLASPGHQFYCTAVSAAATATAEWNTK